MTDTALTSLATKHAAMFRSGDYARLEDAIAGAMTEALDSIDGAELASALLRADKDRRGWMESYITLSAKLRKMEAAT